MESIGRLAGGVAHDFNNMLSVIIGYTDLIMESVDARDPLQKDLAEILAAAQHSADITRQLLTFARKQNIAPRVLDLNETVSDTLKMLRRLIGEDIELIWLPGDHVWPVQMDPSQVDQILANLCVNARDAIEEVGKITIETGNATFDAAYCADHDGFFPGDYVLLAVSDDGCGMDKDTLDNAFEPFFTTKEVGKGTGLGLATVYGIVKQNNGFINIYSEPQQGTTIRIYISRCNEPSEKRVTVPGIDIPTGHGETILVVEDEKTNLQLIVRMLEILGYTVLDASSPQRALALAEEYGNNIDLLLTDVVMPEMNGRDLSAHLQSFRPELQTLFMSGYTANVIAHHGVLDKDVHFIQKPFSKADLAAKVYNILADRPAMQVQSM
jgi:two-component system, cell cycle sensor histidine kinase and response regulator CckA